MGSNPSGSPINNFGRYVFFSNKMNAEQHYSVVPTCIIKVLLTRDLPRVRSINFMTRLSA